MKTIRLFAMFAAAAVAIGAVADYAVYWEVDGAFDMYAQKDVEFDYATISGVSSSDPDNPSPLHQYSPTGGVTDPELFRVYSSGSDPTSTGSSVYSGAASLDGFDSFLVGLYDSDDELVGWQTFSMSYVRSHIWDTSSPDKQSGSPLTVTNVVPEPTSALLMLVGLAGLALKRRRA